MRASRSQKSVKTGTAVAIRFKCRKCSIVLNPEDTLEVLCVDPGKKYECCGKEGYKACEERCATLQAATQSDNVAPLKRQKHGHEYNAKDQAMFVQDAHAAEGDGADARMAAVNASEASTPPRDASNSSPTGLLLLEQ